jgi:hypothetical protein
VTEIWHIETIKNSNNYNSNEYEDLTVSAPRGCKKKHMLACRQNELFFCFNRGNCKKRRGEECCAQINPFQVKTLKVSVPSSTSQFKSRESLTQYAGVEKMAKPEMPRL